LGPTAEAKEIVAKRGLRAARLRAILAEIAGHFSNPNFDLDRVAGTLETTIRLGCTEFGCPLGLNLWVSQ
jgi:hypothetical protein